MREDIYESAAAVFERVFRPMVPYTPTGMHWPDGRYRRASTGNMRNNATKFREVDENTVEIYVNAGDGIVKKKPTEGEAPYAVYTNEPWISPFWKGLKNPNEKWFERATESVAQELAALLGGELSIAEEDI